MMLAASISRLAMIVTLFLLGWQALFVQPVLSGITTTSPLSKKEIDLAQDVGSRQNIPHESSYLIKNSLKKLDDELSKLSDNERKCFDEALSKIAKVAKDPAFRLMFLRTDMFHAKLAAKRYANYWSKRVDLFGPHKAYLPLSQQRNGGAMSNKKDLETLRYGYFKAVPGHQRLLLMDPAATPPKPVYDIDSITKSIFYILQKRLEESTEMQRKGAVVIMDFGRIRFFDPKLVGRVASILNDSFPFRPTMCCIIRPPPGTTFVIGLMKVFMKPEIRERIQVMNNDQQLKQWTGVVVEDLLCIDHEAWLDHIRVNEENNASSRRFW